MAKSLQDQLLAAGALKKDRATRLKKEKHKQDKQRQRGAAQPDEVRRAAQAAAAQKAARDRELSREQQAAAERRAIAAQVRQLIETNAIDHARGDTPYNFSDGGVIRTLYVEPAQHAALAAGRLAVARLDAGYALIPAGAAAKILERDTTAIVVLNSADEAAGDDDDPYAGYAVPDDLTW